ncbi:MAG TPA: lipopolysaccharide kinase InaA family protein [Methylococcaceae bacterium]|nr:lipopolysaccharide kinase InaA family protein [Methylococcaceae bacterium]
MTEEIYGEGWREILARNGLADFDALWALHRQGWFEPPNRRRGGWSGVVRHETMTETGEPVGLFVKFQEDHVYRSILHGFAPRATYDREFANLRRFQAAGLPAPEWVYFGQMRQEGHLRAILVTRELHDYAPLDTLNPQELSRPQRRVLLETLARSAQRMHRHFIQHGSLYPKHIYYRFGADGACDVRLIDLERGRWHPCRRSIAIRDLSSLLRRVRHVYRRTEQLRFLLAYCDTSRLNPRAKSLAKAILRRIGTKD